MLFFAQVQVYLRLRQVSDSADEFRTHPVVVGATRFESDGVVVFDGLVGFSIYALPLGRRRG